MINISYCEIEKKSVNYFLTRKHFVIYKEERHYMNYKKLNENQKNRMKSICNSSMDMKWEDYEFMDYLLGKLPRVRASRSDKEINKEISALEKTIEKYDAFLTDKTVFFNEVKGKLSDIHKKKEMWGGLTYLEVESYLNLHRFCLIYGEGGIGKSYFIKCFEERLEEKHIEHLCVYGKFEKNTNNIDIKEIIEASQDGFVFVVDAINEMSEEGQKELLAILAEIKKYHKIRIVITYRTNSMNEDILDNYKTLATYSYRFQGVSFEDSLNELLKLSVPDVYMYEDILFSNNALFINILFDVLSSDKIAGAKVNGIASVTYILEQYIKKTINKSFNNDWAGKSKEIWEDTKRIAKWMYVNEKNSIDENSLFLIIDTGEKYLSIMMQMGLLICVREGDERYYYFAIDSLTNYLIARSLFEDIKGKTYDESVSIIKSKTKSELNLREALIIAIFDNMSPDYKKIKCLLDDSGLINSLYLDTFLKIHFRRDDIAKFLEVFKPAGSRHLFNTIGGYTDKPFNCSNYLFEYYCTSHERLMELSKQLSGYRFQHDIKQRLKNILYFITLNDREDRRDDEAYCFALLCCVAPNRDVRSLAMKLLYEVIGKNENYVNRVIGDYEKVRDFYIREAIIYVLSQFKRDDDRIKKFFYSLIEREDNLTAKSIRRISTYFGEPYSYIEWNRKNLYTYNPKAYISDYLNDILSHVDLLNKNFLPFRYWGRNQIDIYIRFIATDKNKIGRVNGYLAEKYDCVRHGKCNGWMSFEEKIMDEVSAMAEIEELDTNSFLESFEVVLKYVFQYCNVSENRESSDSWVDNFLDSSYMKCVDVAKGLFLGSLMCNYYTNEFATFNNIQNNIGYEVYDPLEFGEEINITSPIPTHQGLIEQMGDYLLNLLEMPTLHNLDWVKDIELTERNVLHFLEKIEVQGQEWVALAGRVSFREKKDGDDIWIDTYELWCCTSTEETIYEDGNARYLTIELDEYIGELKRYQENTIKPWLCKNVNSIIPTSEILDQTSLTLPPSELIDFFKLKLNSIDMSWGNSNKEKIIICNNNKHSYFRDPIGSTVFMRKDYYDKFCEEHTIKYFAYAERYIPETGYAEETSMHFEIVDGKIEKEIKNRGGYIPQKDMDNELCSKCSKIDFNQNENDESIECLEEYLKKMVAEYGE